MVKLMKILVLGGSGFIGVNIARHLLAGGYAVRILHRPNRPPRYLTDLDPELVVGDLNDRDSLLAAIAGCSHLVHAAGYYPIYANRPTRQLELAKRQMANVLTAVRQSGVERLIYISSLATLGRPQSPEELVDEETPYRPQDFPATYHRIKYEMEQQVLQVVQQSLPTTILIPTAVIGAFDHKPTTGRVVLELLKGKLPVYLNGRLNVVAVRDLAATVEKVLHSDRAAGRYILGNWNTTLKDFLGMVAQIGSVRAPWLRMPWSIAYPAAKASEWFGTHLSHQIKPLLPVTGLDLLRYGHHVNIGKARRELDFIPSPVSIAIKEAIAWFKQEGYL